jgi:UDP-GalNAc:undecaprenyl-phosphate GalNAc-1-phosphate transferase
MKIPSSIDSLMFRDLSLHFVYLITATSLILWLALALQSGDSGVYLFAVHDVATDTNRLFFILSFALTFFAGFFVTRYTLKLPRVDFFNLIIVINVVAYSFLGFSLSTLRLPLASREVFISEFLLSTVLLVAYYLLRNYLFPRRIGVLHGASVETFSQHPALDAVEIGLDDVQSGNFEAVIVDLRGKITPKVTHLLEVLAQERVPVHDVSAFVETIWGRIPLERLTPLELETFTPPPIYKNIKRFSDLALTLLSLPLLLPLGLVITLAIRMDSPGPVLFRQRRVGYRGTSFTMLKFRTMVISSDIDHRFAEKQDKRITRVGRVLRRVRLDELPQFWHVLCGEMSLIGPRPEQQQFAERFSQLISFYGFRHTVRPGISGWAQVMYGYAASDQQTRGKLEFDLYYIKHMSAWLDFVVVIKTLRTIVLGSGAR